jgi:hypothetical protein
MQLKRTIFRDRQNMAWKLGESSNEAGFESFLGKPISALSIFNHLLGSFGSGVFWERLLFLAARGKSRRRLKACSTRWANYRPVVVEQAFSPALGGHGDFC